MKFAIFSILLIVLLSVTIAKRRSHRRYRRGSGGPNNNLGSVSGSTSSGSSSSSTSSENSSSSSTSSSSTTSTTTVTTITGGGSGNTIVQNQSFTIESNSAFSKALDVNVNNEGQSWAAEGVTGFSECSFRGTSPQGFIWKENAPSWYRFTVFAGNVRELGKTTTGVPVKSFKVPKGFKLEYKGMFIKSKYDFPLSQHDNDRIKDIPDNSFAKHVNTWTDETCAINMDFWYMNMQVTAAEYIKVARRIPTYLSLCIENQKLSIRKTELEILLKKYDESSETNKTKLFDIEKKLVEYKMLLEEKKVKLIGIRSQLTTITKILSSQISIDNWIDQIKGYKEEIKVLNEQIKNAELRLNQIREKIKNFERQIEDKNKENIELNSKISTAQIQITETETTVTTVSKQITELEIKKSQKNKEAAEIDAENINIINRIKTYNEEIIKYQKLIAEAEAAKQRNTANYNRITSEMEEITTKITTITTTQTDTKTKITTINQDISKYNLQITNNKKSIEDWRLEITNLSKELSELDIKIQSWRISIQTKTSYANKMTTEYYQQEKTRLEEEIRKLELEISQTTTLVTSATTTREQLQVTISTVQTEENTTNKVEYSDIKTKIQFQLAKITTELNEIKNIFSEQTSYLMDVQTFNSQRIETWAIEAKTKIKKYLDVLPGNPAPIFDMARRRRRRFRRYRRRFY